MTPSASKPIHVLLVGCEPVDARRLRQLNNGAPPTLEFDECGSVRSLRTDLREHDVVILDLDRLTDDDRGLVSDFERATRVPLIGLGDGDDDSVSTAARALGGADYLVKSRLDASVFARAVRYAVERRNLRDVLEAQDRRHRDLFDLSLNGIALQELVTNEHGDVVDSVFLEVNASFERLTGLRAGDVIGRRVTDVIPSAVDDGLIEAFGELTRTGEARRFEFHSRGLGRYYEIAAFMPKPGHIATAFADISERRRAQVALQESEAKYRMLVEQLAGITYRRAVDGNAVTFVSPQIEPVLGFTPDEWLANPDLILEHLHPDDRDMVTTRLEESLRHSRPFRAEYRVRRRDGGLVWFSDEAVVVRDEDLRIPVIQGIMHDITEAKVAEQRLREQDRWFGALIQNALDLIAVVDVDFTALYVSPSVERLLGYKPEDLIGHPATEFIHRDDAGAALAAVQRAFLNPGSAESVQVRIRHVDGSWRYHDATGRVLPSSSRVGGVVINSRDVTDQVRTVQALRESEERFRAIVEATSDWVWEVDAAGCMTYCSPTSRVLLGYEPAELLGRALHDLMPPDEASRVRAILGRIFDRREPISNLEAVILHKHGRRIAIETSGIPILGGEGKRLQGYRGIARDITGRKEVALELERLGRVVEQSSDLTMITDVSGNVLYVNPAFENVTGFKRQEVVGASPRILKSGQHPPEFYGKMWETLLDGEEWKAEFINRRKDGSTYRQLTTVFPVHNAKGDIVNYVAVGRDVTRQVALEEQLRQSQKMEAVGRLAGGVAHDFNNLLTIILGEADLALQSLKPGAELRDVVLEIQAAGQRAAALTRQLLAFSRKQLTETKSFCPNDVIETLQGMLRRLIGEDIVFTSNRASDLGHIRADPSQLEQVLVNLVINARDAMPSGGYLTLESTNRDLDATYAESHSNIDPGRYVMLSVSDTGTGMSDAVKARLFEPFFTTKARGKGTGLGLATCYGIVRQFGGHIGVYSELGTGTTFRIYFPRVDRAAHVEEQPPQPLHGGSETILLVEDEQAVRRIVIRILERLGYQVLSAPSGEEALALWDRERPAIDLLLTDVVLPGMGGRELVEQFRMRCPHVKVLFASGYSDDVLLQQRLTELGDALLSKPFTLESLTVKVRDVLDTPPALRG